MRFEDLEVWKLAISLKIPVLLGKTKQSNYQKCLRLSLNQDQLGDSMVP